MTREELTDIVVRLHDWTGSGIEDYDMEQHVRDAQNSLARVVGRMVVAEAFKAKVLKAVTV